MPDRNTVLPMTDEQFCDLFPPGDAVERTSEGCHVSKKTIPLQGGIYRFRQDDGYAGNFAKQWKKFQTEQYDHINGTSLSRDRIADATKWNLTF
jgi:hypothetical protein